MSYARTQGWTNLSEVTSKHKPSKAWFDKAARPKDRGKDRDTLGPGPSPWPIGGPRWPELQLRSLSEAERRRIRERPQSAPPNAGGGGAARRAAAAADAEATAHGMAVPDIPAASTAQLYMG
jgi:hypothetical protein